MNISNLRATMATSNLSIAFLGLAERSIYVNDGFTPLTKLNILGLKSTILTHFFPISLAGWNMVFCVRNMQSSMNLKIKLYDHNDKEIGSINCDTEVTPALSKPEETQPNTDRKLLQPTRDQKHIVFPASENSWNVLSIPMKNIPILLDRDGIFTVRISNPAEKEEIIGEFSTALIPPLALTAERIAAIKADPYAAKGIRYVIGCNKCSSKLPIYAALERSGKTEAEGNHWYEDIQDTFSCRCGNTNVDLKTIKKNLFGALGHPIHSSGSSMDLIPLYQGSALDDTRVQFTKLIEENPKEEDVQKFIEDNTIILHQFPSHKIIFKPSILSLYKADFAIVTPQKELILVEIEPPDIRLLKNDGTDAAPLTHAFGQVESWLDIIADHKLSVLTSMKLDEDPIINIRGVIIAGRDRNSDPKHLKRLKGRDRGRILFLTYDDLLFSLAVLARQMSQL